MKLKYKTKGKWKRNKPRASSVDHLFPNYEEQNRDLTMNVVENDSDSGHDGMGDFERDVQVCQKCEEN